MSQGNDLSRIKRLKGWIAGLTLLPSAAFLIAGYPRVSLGYFIGGLVVFLNFLGTEQVVVGLVRKKSRGKAFVLLLFMAKLALTAGVIGGALTLDLVSPIALVLGISTFLAALVFDFLFFSRNIEGEEES